MRSISSYINEISWRFERLTKPVNRINLKLPRMNWIDVDTRMEYAIFELLRSYIEDEEGPAQWMDQDGVQEELVEHYNWWKHTYPILLASANHYNPTLDQFYESSMFVDLGHTQHPHMYAEEELKDETTRRMIRLVQLRFWMWT